MQPTAPPHRREKLRRALLALYPVAIATARHRIRGRVPADLRPVLALKARVAQVKTLRPGESAGYHRAFLAAQEERVALIPAGYSDGLPRALAPAASSPGKGGLVLIRGQRCPVIAISSNAIIARLSSPATDAAPGDPVTLLGADTPAAELAALAGSSVYAIAMAMNPSLPRRLV
jgi:alanine racemase